MKYRTIVADPPWPQKDSGPRTEPVRGGWAAPKWIGTRSVVPYPRMSLDEITALPIRAMADTNAHLYLWTTNRFLKNAYSIAEEWGFKASTVLTWCKAPMGLGMGGTFANTTEFCLFCRRGAQPAKQRIDSTWFAWPRGKHSQKPEAFIDLVEQVSPGPYVELFSRRHRLGWDVWGNESANTATLELPA